MTDPRPFTFDNNLQRLAIVELLLGMLEMVDMALLEPYPQLSRHDLQEPLSSTKQAYVDALFWQIRALDGTLRSYRDRLKGSRPPLHVDIDAPPNS